MSEMSAEQVCMDGGGGTQKVESGQNLLEFHILLLLFFCLVTHFHVSSSTKVLQTVRVTSQDTQRSACVQPGKVIPLSFIYRLLV